MQAVLASGDLGIPAALVHQGLISCTPFSPTLAFTTQLLKLYRNAHLCCLHLAIHPFVKALCDLHGMLFHPYLSQQFSISYDLYLSIWEEVQSCMNIALEHNSPYWHLWHACPTCTYKLEGEAQLIFQMLVTMDGNDSLKHWDPPPTPAEGEPEPKGLQVGKSQEHPDPKKVGRDYLLVQENIDRWAKAVLQELLPELEVSLIITYTQYLLITLHWVRRTLPMKALVSAIGQTWSTRSLRECGGSLMRLGYS